MSNIDKCFTSTLATAQDTLPASAEPDDWMNFVMVRCWELANEEYRLTLSEWVQKTNCPAWCINTLISYGVLLPALDEYGRVLDAPPDSCVLFEIDLARLAMRTRNTADVTIIFGQSAIKTVEIQKPEKKE